jgi:hypothetical protein
MIDVTEVEWQTPDIKTSSLTTTERITHKPTHAVRDPIILSYKLQ